MSKKSLLATIVMLLLCSVVFAQINSQKIYSVDSQVYTDITNIYILSGMARPSTTGPWSADELQQMLNRIDYAGLDDGVREIFNKVEKELNAEAGINFKGGAMEFEGTAEIDFYIHTNANSEYSRYDVNGYHEVAFGNRQWWFGKDLNKIDPLFRLNWETYLGKNFYLFFSADLENTIHAKEELGSANVSTNILMLQNLKLDTGLINLNFPNRAFAAFGNEGWSVEIGRDQIKWGAGTVGDLVISNNFPYYDVARFTGYADKFKYTYLLSFFPHKNNYYNLSEHNSSNNALTGLSYYVAHKFETRLFENRLNLALTESLIYMSETNTITPAALSPMYFMHNGYIPSNSNSILSLEADWTAFKGFNIYGQFLLDQFAMPGMENTPGKSAGAAEPNAAAALLGITYKTNLSGGIFTLNPEFAYVGANTYLRNGDINEYNNPETTVSRYGIDYVAAVRSRIFSNPVKDASVSYDEYVIGYKYGPDCITANIAVDWKGTKLDLSANVFGMLHGVHDMWSVWAKVPGGIEKEDYKNQFKTPTTDITENTYDPINYRYGETVLERDAVSFTLNIGLGAKYRPVNNLELSANVDFVMVNNLFNIKNQRDNDVQVIIGAKYNIF